MKVSICVWLIAFAIASASEPQGPDRGNGTTDSSVNATGTITEEPTTNKLKRGSGLFTDDDKDGQPAKGPSQIESVHYYFIMSINCPLALIAGNNGKELYLGLIEFFDFDVYDRHICYYMQRKYLTRSLMKHPHDIMKTIFFSLFSGKED